MKLISVDTARAIWLFPLTELNPTGKSMAEVLAGFIERYGFKRFPKNMMDLEEDGKALVFEGGEFTPKGTGPIIIKLRVYDDGLVADSFSSTQHSEEFLEDAMRWLKEQQGLTLPGDRTIKRLLLSELTVTTDKGLFGLNPGLRDFADLLSKTVVGLGTRVENTGFNVSVFQMHPPDPRKQGAAGPFRFEMKANTAPEEKRFYTQAPVSTDAHMMLLAAFEQVLG